MIRNISLASIQGVTYGITLFKQVMEKDQDMEGISIGVGKLTAPCQIVAGRAIFW